MVAAAVYGLGDLALPCAACRSECGLDRQLTRWYSPKTTVSRLAPDWNQRKADSLDV